MSVTGTGSTGPTQGPEAPKKARPAPPAGHLPPKPAKTEETPIVPTKKAVRGQRALTHRAFSTAAELTKEETTRVERGSLELQKTIRGITKQTITNNPGENLSNCRGNFEDLTLDGTYREGLDKIEVKTSLKMLGQVVEKALKEAGPIQKELITKTLANNENHPLMTAIQLSGGFEGEIGKEVIEKLSQNKPWKRS